MIGVLAMLVSLRDLLLKIPIVRIMAERKEERERTVDLIRELKERQDEYTRRVQVLDWMSYPHTRTRSNPDDTH